MLFIASLRASESGSFFCQNNSGAFSQQNLKISLIHIGTNEFVD